MATVSQNDFIATIHWRNLVAENSATANVEVLIQNHDKSDLFVVFGGATAPTTMSGVRIAKYDSVQGNASAIWIRAGDGDGRASVTLV